MIFVRSSVQAVEDIGHWRSDQTRLGRDCCKKITARKSQPHGLFQWKERPTYRNHFHESVCHLLLCLSIFWTLSIIPARFSRLFSQPLLPPVSPKSVQPAFSTLCLSRASQHEMSRWYIVQGMGTENENFPSFVLVPLTISPPTSLPRWRKPVHLQATVWLLWLLRSSVPSLRKQRTWLWVDGRSCYQHACEEFTLLFIGVCFQLRGTEEKKKVV